jgi:hypothetical protein
MPLALARQDEDGVADSRARGAGRVRSSCGAGQGRRSCHSSARGGTETAQSSSSIGTPPDLAKRGPHKRLSFDFASDFCGLYILIVKIEQCRSTYSNVVPPATAKDVAWAVP